MILKEIKKLFKDTLTAAVEELDNKNKVSVNDEPEEILDHVPSHRKGELLVIYRGSNFKPSRVVQDIIQDEDLLIGVVSIIKHHTGEMHPDEYTDFIKKTIAGLEIGANRQESKISLVSAEFLQEINGTWYNIVVFRVPEVFVEKTLEQS